MHRSTSLSAALLAATFIAAPALAQTTAAPAPSASAPAAGASSAPGSSVAAIAAAPTGPKTVIATVNGQPITMGEVQDAAQDLPAQMQQLPPDQLFPLLVNQQIDRQALLIAAHKENLQNDPQVKVAIQEASDERLENSYVQQQIASKLTDATIQAEYNKDYANKPGPGQVEARHILVKTKAEAESIIRQLNHGAKFATLAEKYSTDTSSKDGGELGWFTQSEMVPSFADAAFALQPGEYTKTPVQTQFGWHVILVEGKRNAPTPPLDDTLKGQIRQALADNLIKETLNDARSKVKIVINNPDGSSATPSPASGAAAPAAAGSANAPAVHLQGSP